MFGQTFSPNGAYHPSLIFIFGGGKIKRFDATADPAVHLSVFADGSCASNIGKKSYIFNETVIRRFDGASVVTETATIPYGIGGDNSASTIDTEIFQFGGSGTSEFYGVSNKIFKWNEVSVSLVGTLAAASHSHSSETLGENIYILGGQNTEIFDTIQKWDGATTSTEASVLPENNSGASVAVVSNAIYIFGGWHDYGSYNTATRSIQKWDGTTISLLGATLADLSEDDFASTLSNEAYIFGSGAFVGSGLHYIQKWNGTTISSLSHKFANNTGYCATSMSK